MHTISNRTIGALVAAAVWDASVCYRLKKRNGELVDAINRLYEENRQLNEEMAYMCYLLNRNGIQLDEFDLIAMPHVRLQEVEQ